MLEDDYIPKILSAYKIVRQKNLNTPIIQLHKVKTPQNNSIYLKAESLQPSGSFKIRGATYSMSQMTAAQRRTGVIAYSTGNHAQAVALAAKELGIPAVIVMSPGVPEYKIEATRSYGAEIIMTDVTTRVSKTEELARTKGYFYIPPFDRDDIIAGQGTIGLEILKQIDPSAVFVPVGGGGLISGIALAIKHSRPDIKIIGVEPELENDTFQSFRAKKRIKINIPSQSIADAIRVPVGEITLPLILSYVDEMLTVTEEQIINAISLCINNAHLWVEPAGALGVAGALEYNGDLAQKPVVCVVSGGNMALSFFCELTQRKT